jgi:PAS domain-containing protein
MTPNPGEAHTTSGQPQQDASLHQAAWPDMLSSLHVAYGDLARTQLELEHRMGEIDETRELFERVIESMSEALFVMDVAGRIIRANRARGRTAGVSARDPHRPALRPHLPDGRRAGHALAVAGARSKWDANRH